MKKEKWKVVEENKYYEVSSLGRVRSLDRMVPHYSGIEVKIKGRMIKIHCNPDGYPSVRLHYKCNKKYISVHRLVALHFIPNPENKPCVNHKDGIKANNNVKNLEWCTKKENSVHANKNGLIKRNYGEAHHNSVLTDSQAKYIRESGLSANKLAKIIPVSISTICKAKRGDTYKNVK